MANKRSQAWDLDVEYVPSSDQEHPQDDWEDEPIMQPPPPSQLRRVPQLEVPPQPIASQAAIKAGKSVAARFGDWAQTSSTSTKLKSLSTFVKSIDENLAGASTKEAMKGFRPKAKGKGKATRAVSQSVNRTVRKSSLS